MYRFPLSLKLFLLSALASSAAVHGADWPNWRGPDYNGISAESLNVADLPDELPILWKAEVGVGFSTVSVLGNRVLTMGNQDDTDTVWCLDAESGEVLWRHSYPCPLDPLYYEGGPSATPTIHGGSVFTLSKKGHAFRLDLATGAVQWKRDLVKDHGFELPEWSFASSPFIDEDGRILLNVGRGGLALSAETGETLWASGTGTSGYSTAVPFPAGEPDATHLFFSAEALIAIRDRDGHKAWEFPSKSSRAVNAADPIVRGSRILLSSSSGTYLLEPVSGGQTPREIWRQRDLKWYFNPGVLIGEHVYSINGTTHRPTELTCTDFRTGETVWAEPGHASGALMATADGTVILLDEGVLTLFEATPEAFRPLHRQQVLEGKTWTVPVLANGRIYCRNAEGDLVCLGASGAEIEDGR